MLFEYQGINQKNDAIKGTVEATNYDLAMETLQKRGYTITNLLETKSNKSDFLNINIKLFSGVKSKDMVMLFRQVSTLFDAQVSTLQVFRLLSAEAPSPALREVLTKIVEDLQAGNTISRALAAHPTVFPNFHVNVVRAGEESGSLQKSFSYLAAYQERNYAVKAKVKNAMIYPIFIISIFILVMSLMLTMVIPQIAEIIIGSGQELPFYTKIVIAFSDFLVNYSLLMIVFIVIGVVAFIQFIKTDVGMRTMDELALSLPYVKTLVTHLNLNRICDNLSTMLDSGVVMAQALTVVANVTENTVFRDIMDETLVDVKNGRPLSDSLAQFPEIPNVMSQMTKVGEESGKLSDILKTLSTFYHRELNDSIDVMIGLIEPAMIVMLGIGVGGLLASVLVPIYSLTANF